MVINAFHPDYVKTYAKEFLSEIKEHSKKNEASKNLSKYVSEKKKTKPNHGSLGNLRAYPFKRKKNQTMLEIHNELVDMSIFKKKEKK